MYYPTMAEHASSSSDAVPAPQPALKAGTVSHRPPNAKPRREPYRLSSDVLSNSSSFALATSPSQQQHLQTDSGHVDVSHLDPAAVRNAVGTPHLQPTPVTPRRHRALSMSSLTLEDDDQLRKTPAEPIARSTTTHEAGRPTTAAPSPSLGGGVGVHGHGNSSTVTANKTIASSPQQDLLRGAATTDTSNTNTNTNDALRGTAQEASTSDAKTTHHGAPRLLYHHNSADGNPSVNEATRPAPTCVLVLEEVFSFFPPSASSASDHSDIRAAVAHILQRESICQLLSRVLLRWSLLYRTRHLRNTNNNRNTDDDSKECDRKGGADPHGGPTAIGSPHSFSLTQTFGDAEKSNTHTIGFTLQSGGLSESSAALLPLCKQIPEDHGVDNSEDGKGYGVVDREAVGEANVPNCAADVAVQQQQEAEGTWTGRPAALVARSASQGPTQPMQVSGETQHQTNTNGSRVVHRDSSPLEDDTFSKESVSQRSLVSQSIPSLRVADVQAPLPSNAARQGVSPGANHKSSCGASTILNSTTTPRQHAGGCGEAPRKTVVSQYLSGTSPSNVLPLQRSSILLSSVGPTTSGLVEAHTLALPATMSNPHSRSQSGVSSAYAGGGWNSSFPGRLNDDFLGATVATSLLRGIIPACMISDSDLPSNSSLYFTPRSRQSTGISGAGDDDTCLSNSSMSAAAMAAAAAAAAGTTTPAAQSISQLLIREAEERVLLQNMEGCRRARKQGEMTARMDQLMMMVLHRKSSERGLHPLLRVSGASSPVVPPPIDSSSTGSCSASEHNLQGPNCNQGVGPGGGGGSVGSRRNVQRGPGRTPTPSSIGIGATALAGVRQQNIESFLREQQQQQQALLHLSVTSRTRPRTSTASTSSPVSRRLWKTKWGTNNDNDPAEAAGSDTDNLTDITREDDELVNIAGLLCRHRRNPLQDGPLSGRSYFSIEGENKHNDENIDGADTATVQSARTVNELGTTRQWLSP